MEEHKITLIKKYIVPILTKFAENEGRLIESLNKVCKLHRTRKYQELETPGKFEEGNIWFSISAIVHSYYYCPIKFVKKGTRIWKKQEFILFTPTLFEKTYRSEYLEMLEPGEVLSISYQNLQNLIEEYPQIEKYIKHLSVSNERHYHERNLLLNKPLLDRVREFEKNNPLFITSASKEIKAMHIGLTRQGYNLQLRKIRDQL